MSFRIFKRKVWKANPDYPNGFEPHVTVGRTVRFVGSADEARRICTQHNADRPAWPKKGYFNFSVCEFEEV